MKGRYLRMSEIKQKNYKEYTVGELLDNGFSVELTRHNINSVEVAKHVTSKFEGTKQSCQRYDDFRLIKGWNGKFEVRCFVKENNYTL